MSGKMNWDKVRQERLVSREVGPLEPSKWDPLPPLGGPRRKQKRKRPATSRSTKSPNTQPNTGAAKDRPPAKNQAAAAPGATARTAGSPDAGHTSGKPAAVSPPARAQRVTPARKDPMKGSSSIDRYFARVREDQAAAGKGPRRAK
jgi:hypothetical protein